MREIADGVILIDDEMPCTPQDIICYEDMVGIFNEKATMEAADILLHFSRFYGQWVAVSYPKIMDKISECYDNEIKSFGLIESIEDWKREMKRYYKMSIITLGLYRLFFDKPEKPTDNDLKPCTLIYTLYLSDICKGLRKLVDNGLVDARMDNDRPSNNGVIFLPNEKLIKMVMKPKLMAFKSA